MRGIGIDLISVEGSNYLVQSMDRNKLGFCVGGIEIDSILEWGSKLTCFGVGAKIDLVLVCGPKITCF